MSESYSEAPRKKIAEHLAAIDFDSAVIITYDRHTNKLMNWWHFSGHPSEWQKPELAELAYKLTAHTAEFLKADANNPLERTVIVQPTRIAVVPPYITPRHVMLGGISIAIGEFKRLCASLNIYNEFGLSVRWYRTSAPKPYAGFALVIAMLALHVSWDI